MQPFTLIHHLTIPISVRTEKEGGEGRGGSGSARCVLIMSEWLALVRRIDTIKDSHIGDGFTATG